MYVDNIYTEGWLESKFKILSGIYPLIVQYRNSGTQPQFLPPPNHHKMPFFPNLTSNLDSTAPGSDSHNSVIGRSSRIIAFLVTFVSKSQHSGIHGSTHKMARNSSLPPPSDAALP